MKKLNVLVIGLALVGGMVSTAFASGSNIAVINVAQILQNSSKVKTLNASIRSKFQPQQAKLAAEELAKQNEAATEVDAQASDTDSAPAS